MKSEHVRYTISSFSTIVIIGVYVYPFLAYCICHSHTCHDCKQHQAETLFTSDALISYNLHRSYVDKTRNLIGGQVELLGKSPWRLFL